MSKNIITFISGLLVVVLISSCSQSESTEKLSVLDAVSPISVTGNASCFLALMPVNKISGETAEKIDQSIQRYQKAATGTLKSLARFERLGWAYVEKARESRDAFFYKLAEQTALCIDSQTPNSAESLLLRGHVLHNLHQFRQAEKLARRLVEQRGLWFDFALLGDVLMERGSLNEAIDAYQIVLNQRPGPQAYARVAQLRWLKGDQEGALEMMALAARSTSPRSPEAAAWVHVQLAQMLMQHDELPLADTALARALTFKPTYPPALHARGRLLLAQNQSQEAVILLQQAVQTDAMPQFRWTLLEALQVSGQHQAAREQEIALRKSAAVEDRRTFSLFLATMGKDPLTALKLAQRELEQRKDVYTLDAVAWAFSAAGLNTEALEYSQLALSEGTQDARLYLHAGVIAARVGDRERALELLTIARTNQQILLPSEQQILVYEFAALAANTHPDARRVGASGHLSFLIGDLYET